MLTAESLTKKYGDQTAVKDVSFSIGQGEAVGLVGHNGSGKSTTMKMLTGLILPTSGKALLNGRDVSQDRTLQRDIGFLPEIPPLYTDMTVREQLRFAAGLKDIPAREINRQIEKAASSLHVEGVLGRLIRNLSKGYRQRVGFAQALLGDPSLLILDEPTVGLDPSQIIEIRQIISSLTAEHTVLLSSHILTEITACCSRILVLSNGKLVADGTQDELLHHAANGFEWTVETDEALDEAKLSALPCVTQVRKLSRSGHPEYTIHASEDIHAALFCFLAAQNCGVRSMKPREFSLEQIFTTLTEDHRYGGGKQ